MSFPNSDALTLIRSMLLLLKEEPVILASPEEAAYFRLRQMKAADKPQQSPVPQVRPRVSETVAKNLRLAETPAPNVSKTVSNKSLIETSKAEIHSPPPPAESNPAPPQPQPKAPFPQSTSLFSSILQKIAPELAILDSIPNDSTAIQLANRWKTKNQSAPISIITCGEIPQHKVLLGEIATALDVYFGPARLIEAASIEKEKQWKMFLSVETLKLIVVCDSTLWQLHNLRLSYKETPATGVRMLADVPIFLLPDLSLYLKDPLLKRSLWKALCSKLS